MFSLQTLEKFATKTILKLTQIPSTSLEVISAHINVRPYGQSIIHSTYLWCSDGHKILIAATLVLLHARQLWYSGEASFASACLLEVRTEVRCCSLWYKVLLFDFCGRCDNYVLSQVHERQRGGGWVPLLHHIMQIICQARSLKIMKWRPHYYLWNIGDCRRIISSCLNYYNKSYIQVRCTFQRRPHKCYPMMSNVIIFSL